MTCIYCGADVNVTRYQAGYAYCMDKECVRKGIKERQSEFRVILMPKQGFGIVHKNSPDLKNGRSSGR